jgi:hypothetical protein
MSLTERNKTKLTDEIKNEIVTRICEGIIDPNAENSRTVSGILKKNLGDKMNYVLTKPENQSKISETIFQSINSSLQYSIKGPILLHCLLANTGSRLEVTNMVRIIFNNTYIESEHKQNPTEFIKVLIPKLMSPPYAVWFNQTVAKKGGGRKYKTMRKIKGTKNSRRSKTYRKKQKGGGDDDDDDDVDVPHEPVVSVNNGDDVGAEVGANATGAEAEVGADDKAEVGANATGADVDNATGADGDNATGADVDNATGADATGADADADVDNATGAEGVNVTPDGAEGKTDKAGDTAGDKADDKAGDTGNVNRKKLTDQLAALGTNVNVAGPPVASVDSSGPSVAPNSGWFGSNPSQDSGVSNPSQDSSGPASDLNIKQYTEELITRLSQKMDEVELELLERILNASYKFAIDNGNVILDSIIKSMTDIVRSNNNIKQSSKIIIVQALYAGANQIHTAIENTYDEGRKQHGNKKTAGIFKFDPRTEEFIEPFMTKLSSNISMIINPS